MEIQQCIICSLDYQSANLDPKNRRIDILNKLLINQSENNKQNNLNGIYEDLITEIKTDYWLMHIMPRIFAVFPKYGDLWKDLFSPFVLFLNILLLLSFSKANSSNIEDPKLWFLSISGTNTLFLVIGIFCSYLIFAIYINTVMTIAPVIVNRLKIRGELDCLYQKANQTTCVSFFKKFYALMKCGIAIFTDKILVFYFILLFLTLLGTIRWSLYFCYLLTYIIHRSSTLMNVLQAIWQPKFSLMMTILLMLMVVYSFSVLAFFWYSDDYPDNLCYSLWSCFVVSYDQTFKSGGGFAGYLTLPYSQNSNGGVSIRYGRVLFDDTSSILIVLLILGIISAIIIDQFGELRQKNKELEDLLNSNDAVFKNENSIVTSSPCCTDTLQEGPKSWNLAGRIPALGSSFGRLVRVFLPFSFICLFLLCSSQSF